MGMAALMHWSSSACSEGVGSKPPADSALSEPTELVREIWGSSSGWGSRARPPLARELREELREKETGVSSSSKRRVSSLWLCWGCW